MISDVCAASCPYTLINLFSPPESHPALSTHLTTRCVSPSGSVCKPHRCPRISASSWLSLQFLLCPKRYIPAFTTNALSRNNLSAIIQLSERALPSFVDLVVSDIFLVLSSSFSPTSSPSCQVRVAWFFLCPTNPHPPPSCYCAHYPSVCLPFPLAFP